MLSKKLDGGNEVGVALGSVVGPESNDTYSIQSSSEEVYPKKIIASINFPKDKDKLCVIFEVNIKQLSSAEHVVVECKWTDFLQRLVDYGNVNILKSFQLRLKMEDT